MKNKGSVCVTGGTGYLASWLIRRLLEHGYSVNTTIRPSSTPERRNISYLTDLPGASERLHIFKADLNKPESFVAAIEGCVGVFHMAHPIDVDGAETEEAKIQKAVAGMTGILRACVNSTTVKRVVYTSTTLTIAITDEDLVDETTPSDLDFMRKILGDQWAATYAITKVLTENAAFDFAEKNGLELVTILPPFVQGPFITPFFPDSVRLAMAMILGEEENYGGLVRPSFVHVDDLVRAHIFLFEHPDAKGKYICSAAETTIDKLAEFLRERYPDQYPIPTAEALKDVKGFAGANVSSKKLLDAGFKYNYGLEDIFDGAIECCKQKGFL